MARRKTISIESKTLFAAVAAGLSGCWSDEIRIDRKIVEANTCPSCWQPLEYRGFSNMEGYTAYGICVDCEFATKFWTEGAELSTAKKQICKAVESV